MKELITRLSTNRTLNSDELLYLLSNYSLSDLELITQHAREQSKSVFGNKIYIRGLIEVSSFCKNNCYYCGLRAANKDAERYRLSKEQILDCCRRGYEWGFRTFVLQGGEDLHLSDDWLVDVISTIRSQFADVAITLSLGERGEKAFQRFYDAGANRYLLRHETFNKQHYEKLHPLSMSYQERIDSLNVLKKIGYQVGTGIMVGSPHQTIENIVEDILFIERFRPQMIGIGPYISQHNTPFSDKKNGTMEMTLMLIAIFRLMNPYALIPSTTALSSIHPDGREKGILAGANVIMPNLSPQEYRAKYAIYDNKRSMGSEAAEQLQRLEEMMGNIGYTISDERGDYNENNKLNDF